MISIHYKTADPYRIYGINHFMLKYGLRVGYNRDSEINIIYGLQKEMDGFIIRIIENEMLNDICGYLKINKEKIPLFERPVRLDGEPLVTYTEEGNEYPCVVYEDSVITIGFDIFNEIGHLLSGNLEHFWRKNNNKSKELMRIPVVDCYEEILFGCIKFANNQLNIRTEYKPFWPDGKKFAVCLTHDVDRVKKTFQYATNIIRYLYKGKIRLAFTQVLSFLKKENPYWNFERIMEIERKLGAKSTFFFLNERQKVNWLSPKEWKLYRGRYNIKDPEIVDMIQRLDREGWEIGIHGSYNSYKDIEMLEKEKKILEKIVGKKVHGISQHYCNLEVPKTWEFHEKLELKYDSSIGFVSDMGFRYGTCFPFHPFNPKKGKILSVWELPISIMDNACSYDHENVWKEILDILNNVERYNGVLVLRWHQSVFNEREFPLRSKIYEKLIEICKERNAWITTARDLVEWLNARERMS